MLVCTRACCSSLCCSSWSLGTASSQSAQTHRKRLQCVSCRSKLASATSLWLQDRRMWSAYAANQLFCLIETDLHWLHKLLTRLIGWSVVKQCQLKWTMTFTTGKQRQRTYFLAKYKLIGKRDTVSPWFNLSSYMTNHQCCHMKTHTTKKTLILILILILFEILLFEN